jgi:uncharacterized protein YabN with tetrapyrrole methylase and pyrophosphatase domain
MTNSNQFLQQLIATVQTLRSDNGCPWDKKQTPHSLITYLKAEAQELIDAIENNDVQNVCEELGDVLYLLIMIAEAYGKDDAFTFETAIEQVNAKLIRRHPHVFAGTTFASEEELRDQWQRIKAMEKQKK